MDSGKHFTCKLIATGQTDAPIDNLELSSDGLYLAAGLEDGGACCWGLPTPIQPDIDDDPVSLAMKGKNKGRKIMKQIDEEQIRESGTVVAEDDEDDEDDEDAPKQPQEDEEVPIVDLALPLFRIEPPSEPKVAGSVSAVEEEASQVSTSSKKSKKGALPPPETPAEDTSPGALAKKKSRYLPR